MRTVKIFSTIFCAVMMAILLPQVILATVVPAPKFNFKQDIRPGSQPLYEVYTGDSLIAPVNLTSGFYKNGIAWSKPDGTYMDPEDPEDFF